LNITNPLKAKRPIFVPIGMLYRKAISFVIALGAPLPKRECWTLALIAFTYWYIVTIELTSLFTWDSLQMSPKLKILLCESQIGDLMLSTS